MDTRLTVGGLHGRLDGLWLELADMKPAVDIYLDGKKFAFRTWEVIPRVGDVVLLQDGEIFAEVTRVFWGDDSSAPTDRQWVQIACKTIDRE